MENFYFNEDLRKEYAARGLERAKLLSWEKTTKKITGIILKEAANKICQSTL